MDFRYTTHQYKIFKTESEEHPILLEPWDTKKAGPLLKNERRKGNKQVIITLEVAIAMIRDMYLNQYARISKLEFTDIDSKTQEEITQLIQQTNQNAAYLLELVEYLNRMTKQSSINFLRLHIEEQKCFCIQVDGVCFLNECVSDTVIDKLKKVIGQQIK